MAPPFDFIWNPGDGRILVRLLIAAVAGAIVGWNPFLGAGEIFRDLRRPDRVHGLTSAAALWVTAALGIVAGCGSVLLVSAVTGMVVLVILVAPHLDRRCSATPGSGPL